MRSFRARSPANASSCTASLMAAWLRSKTAVPIARQRCPWAARKATGYAACTTGLKFNSAGVCEEIPGQTTIPPGTCVRAFPVIEKDNWVWVWMGAPALADPGLICFSVGPSDPDWNIRTSQMHVETNYRREIENLADLSHIAWVHPQTVGGDRKYSEMKSHFEITPRGLNTRCWVHSVAPTGAVAHLFPEGTKLDICLEIQHTVPCNWIMHFRAFTAGSATVGESNGQLVVDTWTCQAVTPCDDDSVDYYYSWGASKETEFPGLSDLLGSTLDEAFEEDRIMLEAQHQRRKQRPNLQPLNIVNDTGPIKMLWVLDKLLAQERSATAPSRNAHEQTA